MLIREVKLATISEILKIVFEGLESFLDDDPIAISRRNHLGMACVQGRQIRLIKKDLSVSEEISVTHGIRTSWKSEFFQLFAALAFASCGQPPKIA